MTRYEKALYTKWRNKGFFIEPRKVRQLSGKIRYHVIPKVNQARALHVAVETKSGIKIPFIEVRRPDIDAWRETKKNPDFGTLFRNNNLSVALNKPHESLAFGMSGGVHYLSQLVEKHDVENLLAIMFVAFNCDLNYKSLKDWCVPKCFWLGKNLRRKVEVMRVEMLKQIKKGGRKKRGKKNTL